MNYIIKKIDISYTISADLQNMHFIRNETEKIFTLLNINDDSVLFKMKLVIDELVNNAMEHGSKQGHDIFVKISIINGNTINIEVSDDGSKNEKGIRAINIIESIKYARENQITNNLSKNNKRGRGLAHIVSDWADELNIKDNDLGGITVTVIKNL